MRRILSPSERDALAALVAEIESKTAGELVTVVLRRSSSYAAHRVGWATALSLFAAAVVHLLWPRFPTMELLGAELLLASLFYWLLGVPSLQRIIVPRALRNQATHRRAKALFLELGVTETRDRSGVLILLSELERRVEILGDRGIHEHMGAEAWKSLVAELVASIRGGSAADGLRAVLERLGRELSEKFPVRSDDRNELPNHVIMDET